MKVKFIRKPAKSEGGQEFEVGQVYDIDKSSAERWKRRGAVVYVQDETVSEQPAPVEPVVETDIDKPSPIEKTKAKAKPNATQKTTATQKTKAMTSNE